MKILQMLILLTVNISGFAQMHIPNFIYNYGMDDYYFVGYNNQLYECVPYIGKYRNITNLCFIDQNGFLRINYKIGETSYFIIKEQPHYLILSPRQLFIFSSDEWINVFKNYLEYDYYRDTFIENIESNVFLTENDIEYSPDNLLKRFFSTDREFPYDYWSRTLPLAVDNSQINIFEMEIEFQDKVEGILILNGFVDFYRPHLYKDNSRIKEIQIIDKDGNFEQNYNIQDIIEFQEIIFPVLSDNIIIKIISFYNGTKYTDICCSAILPIFNEEMRTEARVLPDEDYSTFINEMFNDFIEIK
jgi:hypothetical protein